MLLEKTALTVMASLAAAVGQIAISYPEQRAAQDAAMHACQDAKKAVLNAAVDWVSPEVKAVLDLNQAKTCSTY